MLLVLAFSIVVGTNWEESYAVMGLTAVATFIKGWSEFKKYLIKINVCRFSYTTSGTTLIEVKNFARGGLEDMSHFLVKMKTRDEIVRDFTPPTCDGFITLYSTIFVDKAFSVYEYCVI